MAAKAVNIPWDEMRDITVTNTGGGWLKGALVGAALAAGVGGAGLGALALFNAIKPGETTVIQQPGETKTINRDWRLGEPVVE